MIVYTIVLSIAGVFVVALAIIATIAIQESRRQAHYKERAYSDVTRAMIDIDTFGSENSRLREENANLTKMLRAEVEALKEARQENADLRERCVALEVGERLLREQLAVLEARNGALQKTLEAQPTQPKRAVRKNATQATEQETH